jgi:hypothetical protein
MIDLEATVRSELDRLVPRSAATADWPEVVARSRAFVSSPSRRGRRLARALPLAAAAAAVAVLVLAWPFGGGPSGTVLERAAAAIGDGPVLHAVIEDGFHGTLVNLASGARSEIHQQDDYWYDPSRGIHEIETFAGVVQADWSYPPGKVAYVDKTFAMLAAGYRTSLANGTAKLLGPAVVNGQAVYWIRVDTRMLPDSQGRLLPWAHDVAVAQDTYKPVATRETRNGQLSPDGISLILSIETLPAGSGDITGADHTGSRSGPFRSGPPQQIDAKQARAALGTDALWAGQSVAGLHFAGTWKSETHSRYDPATGTWAEKHDAVMIVYGRLDPNGRIPGQVGVPDPATPFVEVSESPTLFDTFQRGVLNYSPPEGSLLLFGGRIGIMQADGLHLALEGSSEDVLVAAARALQPMPS